MYVGEFVPWKSLKPVLTKHLGKKEKVKGVVAERRFSKTRGFVVVTGEELILWKVGKFLNDTPKDLQQVNIKACTHICQKKSWGKGKLILKSKERSTSIVCNTSTEAAVLLDILENIRNNKEERKMSGQTAKTRLLKITDSRHHKRAL